MKFTGRIADLDRLHAASAEPTASLVIVRGRRRMGVTRLLLEWVGRRDGVSAGASRAVSGAVFWVAEETAAALQRRSLAEALGAVLPGFSDVAYPDWASLFARVARDAWRAGVRGPLVIDALPHLLASSPELPAVLQRFFDHEAKRAHLIVALGGATSPAMSALTDGPHAPLYRRAREVIALEPLPIGQLGEVFGLRDPAAIVATYACWGGVPLHWELASPLPGMRETVDALVLDPRGPLHDEPPRLLREEGAIALRPILDAIGGGAHRASEIAAELGQAPTSLARPLVRLAEVGLVTREVPFGEPAHGGKRASYELADPFLRLWFSLVGPRRGFLLSSSPRARVAAFDETHPRLVAVAWSELCRQAVPSLGDRLGGMSFGPARRFWRTRGPRWDVVAEAARGDGLLLGAALWSDRAMTSVELDDLVADLVARGLPEGTRQARADVHHVIFLPHAPPRVHRHGARVHIVDAAAVIAALREPAASACA